MLKKKGLLQEMFISARGGEGINTREGFFQPDGCQRCRCMWPDPFPLEAAGKTSAALVGSAFILGDKSFPEGLPQPQGSNSVISSGSFQIQLTHYCSQLFLLPCFPDTATLWQEWQNWQCTPLSTPQVCCCLMPCLSGRFHFGADCGLQHLRSINWAVRQLH